MEGDRMTVTESDAILIDEEPATEAATNAGERAEDAQLARARDGQDTPDTDPLPDTHSDFDLVWDWWANVVNTAAGLWNGSIWDEQPPSPRELVERYRESSWTLSSHWQLLRLRQAGLLLSLTWSVPLYLLAIAGQRFGRALIAVIVTVVFWHLI
jgi:hypothetical protein